MPNRPSSRLVHKTARKAARHPGPRLVIIAHLSLLRAGHETTQNYHLTRGSPLDLYSCVNLVQLSTAVHTTTAVEARRKDFRSSPAVAVAINAWRASSLVQLSRHRFVFG